MGFRYLMEREDESLRLRTKDRGERTSSQLLDSGIESLPDRPHLVDAGTGAGVVARQMAEIISRTHEGATLSLLDGSSQRLQAARENLSEFGSVDKRFITCNLQDIPLESESVDYLFCRFVFEYLENPGRVFDEFCRVVKPGGKIVVGDLDYNSMSHYPLSDELQQNLNEMVSEVQRRGLLDFYAGRKLYRYFYERGYTDITARVYAHHLFYGELEASDEMNWSKKIEQIVSYQEKGLLELGFDVKRFGKEFSEFLRSPGRFSYTPLIIVEGVKP